MFSDDPWQQALTFSLVTGENVWRERLERPLSAQIYDSQALYNPASTHFLISKGINNAFHSSLGYLLTARFQAVWL
jgi:hypothetical protein